MVELDEVGLPVDELRRLGEALELLDQADVDEVPLVPDGSLAEDVVVTLPGSPPVRVGDLDPAGQAMAEQLLLGLHRRLLAGELDPCQVGRDG